MLSFLLAALAATSYVQGSPLPFNQTSTHSEPFYLMAVQLPGSVSITDDICTPLEELHFGSQPVVYNEDGLVLIDPTVDASLYNVTGIINEDRSLSVNGKDDTFLTVEDKLGFTDERSESAGHFDIYFGNLGYNNETAWTVCGCEGSGKKVLTPKSKLQEKDCNTITDVVVRTYSYTTGGGIPDFPLHI